VDGGPVSACDVDLGRAISSGTTDASLFVIFFLAMSFSRLVFVSYTHEDRERVRPLVELLDRKLREIDASIFWDPKLRAGARISEEIYKLLSEAACVVVIWTVNSVSSQWIHGECEAARQDGRLVPVVMEQGADVRPPFNALSHVLLDPWHGEETPAFHTLWFRFRLGSGVKNPIQGNGECFKAIAGQRTTVSARVRWPHALSRERHKLKLCSPTLNGSRGHKRPVPRHKCAAPNVVTQQ
jgi:hypothetical protein